MKESLNSNKLVLTLFFYLVIINAYSQGDISKYFNDDGISEANKIIKIGYDPINGELPIAFEHLIAHHVSLEWGAGLVSMKRQSKLYNDDPLPNLPASGFGYTLWVGLRIYLKDYYERSYLGLQPKLTILNGNKYKDLVFFNYGYQFPIKDTWVIDISLGLGMRYFKYKTTVGSFVQENKDTRFFIPLQVKIGYAF